MTLGLEWTDPSAWERTVWIVHPHRGLAASKSRLSSILDAPTREKLARVMLKHVLRVSSKVQPNGVLVVSPDPSLEGLVVRFGARFVRQRGVGLNSGLSQVSAAALKEAVGAIAVVHCDLPDVESADLIALLNGITDPRTVAIAPNRAGTGTNALAMNPPNLIPFSFGLDSFAKHLQSSNESGSRVTVVDRPGTRLDVDTPEDLEAWCRAKGGNSASLEARTHR